MIPILMLIYFSSDYGPRRHGDLPGTDALTNPCNQGNSCPLRIRHNIATGDALLDEPTSALDPELVSEVLTVIRGLAQNGMTMVMATHQMGFTRALADEVLFMQDGRIIEQGSPRELLAEGSGTRTLDFCSRILEMEGL